MQTNTATETLLAAARSPGTRFHFGRASVVKSDGRFHIAAPGIARVTSGFYKAADMLTAAA